MQYKACAGAKIGPMGQTLKIHLFHDCSKRFVLVWVKLIFKHFYRKSFWVFNLEIQKKKHIKIAK